MHEFSVYKEARHSSYERILAGAVGSQIGPHEKALPYISINIYIYVLHIYIYPASHVCVQGRSEAPEKPTGIQHREEISRPFRQKKKWPSPYGACVLMSVFPHCVVDIVRSGLSC